ncbi:uncharacterized protein LAESUDRAFT_132785 [Laetiporus sulphureus 93-53]|uniref:Uncharacterized protein n=1 Tax=Laetiporus sulphureus 93-53 TaxID=1314785 RepID=A0A165EI83_9APHY|nr:uncharacterized protein LAESUDRAFT_132785 [Laetiporus sulphureus 93-53]KZT07103.1 hypothetical protein LAESUDRAFT_132785 [Laetiporus sulphureus 93-53]
MSSRTKSKPLAIATVVGSLATLGYMYIAGMQIKKEEGSASIFKEPKGPGNLTNSGSDARMSSAAVRSAVHGDRKS